ncbi:MAG: hypothetical protein L3J39_10415 [Verrucomicrobiales bacterium]|nr:hypothetical protein [Verrucomicrobiales bacterium]
MNFFRRSPYLFKRLCDRLRVWKFSRYEVVFMRVLFAFVIYQTMPLGKPFSTLTQDLFPAINPAISSKEKNESLRPPLPPIVELLPNSSQRMTFDSQPVPNGIAHWVDLTFFSNDRFVALLPWIVIPAILLYASGIGLPITLPLLTFISIGSRTLSNSQGAINHGFQLVSAILLVQTGVILFGVIYRLIKKKHFVDSRQRTIRDYYIYSTILLCVSFYMIAGYIKLIKSDGEWIQNSPYIGIQLVKTDRQNYYTNMDGKHFGKAKVRWASDMLEHPNFTRVFMACGLCLELFAFIALFGRAWCAVTGLMILAFHQLNDSIMGLMFYHNEKIVWIFLVNIPFWIVMLNRRIRKDPALIPLLSDESEDEIEASPA